MPTKKTATKTKTKRVSRADAFVNNYTGLNTDRDKRTFTRTQRKAADNVEDLDTLYEDNDLAFNITSLPAQEMTREWIDLQGDDAEDVEKELTRLGTQRAFYEAIMWSRLFGTGLIMMGVDKQRPMLDENGAVVVDDAGVPQPNLALPLQLGGQVRWLQVFDRYEANAVEVGTDGSIVTYDITTSEGKTMRVHASRILRIDADPTPRRRRERGQWGQSVLRRCMDAIRDLDVATAGVGTALNEFDVAVMKIKGLAKILAADKGKALQTKLANIDLMRSMWRHLVIDADGDEMAFVPHNFGGVSEVLNILIERVASAARMPVSLLMGRAPTGLNNSSDADIRNWYAYVRAEQHAKMTEPLTALINVIVASMPGTTAPTITFAPLWQPTEKEQADTRLTMAQADTAYVDMGALDADEVRAARFASTGFSVQTTTDDGIEGDDDIGEDDPTATEDPTVSTPPTTEVQKTALNGAQIDGMKGIVADVASGKIPRDSGVAQLAFALQVTDAEAEKLMGSAGRSFTPTVT